MSFKGVFKYGDGDSFISDGCHYCWMIDESGSWWRPPHEGYFGKAFTKDLPSRHIVEFTLPFEFLSRGEE